MRRPMHIAFSEFKKWLFSPKIVLFIVMIIFVRENLIVPMQDAADTMFQPLNILEPCIASLNSGLSVLAILLCYILTIADFPSSGGNECYYIYRAGKKSCAMGEVIFMVLSAFIYLFAVIFLIGLQASPDGFWADGWSIPATDYDKSHNSSTGFIMANAISENIVTNMAPFKAIIYSFFPTMLSMILYAFIYLEGTLLGRKVKTYSLGMRQRLGLAQALMEDPGIYILDEPFNGIDREGAAEIRKILIDEKGKGKTILLSSHNDKDISEICDKMIEMDAGKIVKETKVLIS